MFLTPSAATESSRMETTIAEETVLKLDISYRLLFEKNPLPMWVYEVATLRMLAVNEAATERYGYSEQEIAGLTLADLHHADDLEAVHAHLQLPVADRTVTRMWRHRHRDGGFVEVETTSTEVNLEGRRAVIMLVRDMAEQRRTEQSQRELTLRLASTLECITDGFFTLDRNWCFTCLNARAEELLNARREDLLGSCLWEAFPETVGGVFQTEYQRVMSERKTASFEAWSAPLKMWLGVDAYPCAQGLTVYFRDVTEKHLAAQRLLEEREILAAVVSCSGDAIITMDVEGRIKMFSPGAARIFRRTHASIQGQNMDVLLPERFRAEHRHHLQRFSESSNQSRMMGLGLVRGLRSDGQELDLEGTISQVTGQDRVLIANLRDMTERLHTDAVFEQSRAQLSDLTQRLMTQEKALVKRLAQALHDQLGQTMAAIRMAHETIMTLQTDQTSLGVQRLQAQLGTLIGQAIRQVRQVLIDLRPPLLDEHGLSAALDNELRNRSLTQLQVDFSIDVNPEVANMRWPTEVEYAAFMVAREAVENALRHSGATSVDARLSGTANSLQLEVADNGVGIGPGATVRPGHLGILGMHERAHAVGAIVTVDAGATKGTCVRFGWQSLPLI